MTNNDYRNDLSPSNPVAETDSQQSGDVGSPAQVQSVGRVDSLADESTDSASDSTRPANETTATQTDAHDDQWLVVLCGLPGVGKSTVARDVMERIDATRLRTDVIRKELFDEPDYSAAERDTVYQTLYDRAETLLAEGQSVVLDATFAQEQYRPPVEHIADEHDVEFQFVKVVCEQSVVEERIASRDDVSDADFEVYQHFKRTFEPLETEHVTVDNSTSRADTHEQVRQLF